MERLSMAEKFTRWDAVDYLKSDEDMALYLDACLEDDPGDGSLVRAWFSTLAQEVCELAFEMRGWSGLTRTSDPITHRDWVHEYLWSFQETIGGGTLEIQKNIVGERLLGLPR